jgi:hypothetical protein
LDSLVKRPRDGPYPAIDALELTLAMRFRLRTLLTLMAAGPPLVAWAWFNVENSFEFVGWLTFMAILSLAYWSLSNR